MIQKKWPLATFLMVIKNEFLLLGPVKKLFYLFQQKRMGRKVRVLPQHLLGRLLGILQKGYILGQIGDLELRQAVLPVAEEVSRSP